MKCCECKWLDRSVVLTSNPPQYRCTLGFGSHYADHECEYDFMPMKRGKWINKQKPNINYIPPYNCSECGGAGYGTDYCPNCGAKMDKE